jgi:sterol desaturase/sphingolipid hydroxylase (fatty acid hydroxylase superfamily)
MDARLIAVASPIFFVLIFVEVQLLRRRKVRAYHLHDSIADLSCGVGEQVCQVFTFALELGAYSWLYTHARLHTFSIRSVVAWILLIVLFDLSYYWFHRASHRINLFWAVHAVHHQSEEYNFTVALRQGWLEPLMMVPFHAPIALLGFPPEMFFIGFTAHTLLQFWPHTRAIGKLPIDGIFNSPSNHRCHHAINPEYIDKNYSGFLILWDRLFGTWAREQAEPAWGTVKPLASFNPLWANLSFWTEMRALARRCTRLADKLSVPFRPPEWRPAELGGPVAIPPITRETQRRYDVTTPRPINRYAVFCFVFIVAALPALTQQAALSQVGRLAGGAFVIAGLCAIAGTFEGKRWARPLELVRVATFPLVAWLMTPVPYQSYGLGLGLGLGLVHGAWLLSASRV